MRSNNFKSALVKSGLAASVLLLASAVSHARSVSLTTGPAMVYLPDGSAVGPDAVARSRGPTPLPPGGALQNGPLESGISFMWHSHNEREITTNDVFPGGMLMMMLVDPPVWYIDETL
jgi:hypothetical protein